MSIHKRTGFGLAWPTAASGADDVRQASFIRGGNRGGHGEARADYNAKYGSEVDLRRRASRRLCPRSDGSCAYSEAVVSEHGRSVWSARETVAVGRPSDLRRNSVSSSGVRPPPPSAHRQIGRCMDISAYPVISRLRGRGEAVGTLPAGLCLGTPRRRRFLRMLRGRGLTCRSGKIACEGVAMIHEESRDELDHLARGPTS
jgi:hypothetical protein